MINSLEKLNRIARRRKNRKYCRRLGDARYRVLIEGDSWLEYPLFIKDIGDWIVKIMKDSAVWTMAGAGDTIDIISHTKEEFLNKAKEMNPHLIILSGGGNDLLGDNFIDLIDVKRDLLNINRFYTNSPHSRLNFKFWIDTKKIRKIADKVVQLAKLSEKRGTSTYVLINGYDYPWPGKNTNGYWNPFTKLFKYISGAAKGRWLHQKLNAVGLNNIELQKDLVAACLDEFRKRVKNKIRHRPNIDLFYPDPFPKKEFYDEIHLRSRAYKQVARSMLDIWVTHLVQ